MRIWILFGCLLLSACGSDDNGKNQGQPDEKPTTKQLYPEFLVTSDGSGDSLAEARIHVSGKDNTYWELNQDDQVAVTVEGNTKYLVPTTAHTVAESFPYDDPGVTFIFGFLRAASSENAAFSTVVPPERFELSVAAQSASRAAQSVALSWQPPGSGQVSYEISGSCVTTLTGTTEDDGDFAVPALTASASSAVCDVTATLSREQQGTVDSRFAPGGSTRARQVRSVTFSSSP